MTWPLPCLGWFNSPGATWHGQLRMVSPNPNPAIVSRREEAREHVSQHRTSRSSRRTSAQHWRATPPGQGSGMARAGWLVILLLVGSAAAAAEEETTPAESTDDEADV